MGKLTRYLIPAIEYVKLLLLYYCNSERGGYRRFLPPAPFKKSKKKRLCVPLVRTYASHNVTCTSGILPASYKLFSPTQDALFGDFVNNKPHGEVLAHYCDGSKHQGTFREGTRHGKGTTEEENGNRVIGTWAVDKRDGVFEVRNALEHKTNDVVDGLVTAAVAAY